MKKLAVLAGSLILSAFLIAPDSAFTGSDPVLQKNGQPQAQETKPGNKNKQPMPKNAKLSKRNKMKIGEEQQATIRKQNILKNK